MTVLKISKLQGFVWKTVKGWKHILYRRLVNQGRHLLCFPLNQLDNDLVVPMKFTAFTKSTSIEQKLKEKR